MHIRSLKAFTAFTGEMKVFNVGDTDELPDDIAQRYIDDGMAEEVEAEQTARLPQLDHDGDGKPGGSKPKAKRAPKKAKADEAPTELGEARKRYRDAFGKNPGPRWSVEEIDAKIAEAATAKDDEETPPAEDDEDSAPA